MDIEFKSVKRSIRRSQKEKIKAKIERRVFAQIASYRRGRVLSEDEIDRMIHYYCAKDGKSHRRTYCCGDSCCDWCVRNLTRQHAILENIARYELTHKDEWYVQEDCT